MLGETKINLIIRAEIHMNFVKIHLVIVVFNCTLGFSIPVESFTVTIGPSILPKMKIEKNNLEKGKPGSNLSLGLEGLPTFL